MKKICIVIGTRPEGIKLAPLVLGLRSRISEVDCKVCVTGQHKEMLYQVLDLFEIVPDIDLGLMQPNQSLCGLASRAIEKLDKYFKAERPDIVVVQGDTTTVLAGALTAFYNKIPVAHVEAGLRTWNLKSPFPEEANRVLTTRITDYHFCPTEVNRKNLLDEGVDESKIYVTGNTVIDVLFMALEKAKALKPSVKGLPGESLDALGNKRMVLITGHRRENFGDGFEQICGAITDLAKLFPETEFVYPVHLNPNVREPVNRIIGDANLGNIHLIPPQDYLPFVSLMSRSHLILTDSGGVQEEAPSLGKPVLVMRDTTERPEAVTAGAVKLVGASRKAIVSEASLLLTSSEAYEKMAQAINPYGDGKAVDRIIDVLLK